MDKFFRLIISVLFIFSCTKPQTFELPKEVKIESGQITGVPGRNHSIIVFKGIPYAVPPVGDLRWRPPQPVKPWEGIKACDKFGPSAMQAPQAPFMMWSTEFIIDTSLGYSEDCLTLNVWTDADSSDGKRPVLLFIHGGAYTSGGSSCEIYDGEGLAKKGVVVVTINYRLGVFGFFTHPTLSAESENRVSGNYGILDMIAALKWVKQNIAAFGGDPDNVTIQGQSAGASAVNVLLLSPLAKGLFHRAIPQSFNLLNRKMPTLSEMEAAGLESAITDNNGTPMDRSDDRIITAFGSKLLPEMRAMRAEDLLAVSFPSSPHVDGYVLPDDMLEVLKAGHQNDVPVLIGMVEGDAMLFSGGFGGQPVNLETYLKSATEKYGEYADKFLALYPANNDAEASAQNRESSLDNLNVLSYYSGKARSIKGKTDTYIYFFTHVMPGPQSSTHGAFHTADVPYSLNYLSPLRGDYWTKLDYDIGNRMSEYWVNFMKVGDPNGQELPEWPAWKDGELGFMELGDTFSPVSIPKEKADFWKAYYDKKFDLK
jgi:para-nitrobenzyl esterase